MSGNQHEMGMCHWGIQRAYSSKVEKKLCVSDRGGGGEVTVGEGVSELTERGRSFLFYFVNLFLEEISDILFGEGSRGRR